MNFNEELKQRVEQINALLAAKLPAEEGMQQRVAEAMNYSVNAGGKRLRPMLLLEVYRLLGGNDEKIMEPFMAALECIHTYSLVHLVCWRETDCLITRMNCCLTAFQK